MTDVRSFRLSKKQFRWWDYMGGRGSRGHFIRDAVQEKRIFNLVDSDLLDAIQKEVEEWKWSDEIVACLEYFENFPILERQVSALKERYGISNFDELVMEDGRLKFELTRSDLRIIMDWEDRKKHKIMCRIRADAKERIEKKLITIIEKRLEEKQT